jgi:hypothetical protein
MYQILKELNFGHIVHADCSVLPHRKRGVLYLMVRWYPRRTSFTTWDRCSRRMGISMKMLVIELKMIG